MKILVFGVTGLIGSSIFKALVKNPLFDVYGTCRSSSDKFFFHAITRKKILSEVVISELSAVQALINRHQPDVIINCIGITKHLPESDDYQKVIALNALWPHQLAKICDDIEAKLIHVSTDCVFSGKTGNYSEVDIPDATDLYGRSKALGEVVYGKHLTLRISTIGHEIRTSYGLLNWFLSQRNSCKGYSRAFFLVYRRSILRKFFPNLFYLGQS